MSSQEVQLGKYKHFKGDIVEVLHVALDSEDPTKEYVVYKHDETVWARPKDMFLESIERDSYSGPRFIFVGDN